MQRYTATVVITAPDQQSIFDTFGALVDACIDVANASPVAHLEVEELDPFQIETVPDKEAG